MGKNGKRFTDNQSNGQHRFHNRRPPKWSIIVLLENGASFEAKMVTFDNPNMPKCKVFFKSENKKELCVEANIAANAPSSAKETNLRNTINEYLVQLHNEAILDFPEWLEKYSTQAEEENPFFNLDEIREEFKYKKSRFGIWCIAAKAGFFSELKPLTAKINKVVHLEIREQIINVTNVQN